MDIDFRLKKDIIPTGKLHSEFAIFSWDRKQEMQKEYVYIVMLGVHLCIQPQDAYRQYYFLCGDHYSNEKKED